MPEFKLYQTVKHVATNRAYIILAVPTPLRKLEHFNEPYYEYVDLDQDNTPTWLRPQSEMEDGRFVVLTPAERLHSTCTFK